MSATPLGHPVVILLAEDNVGDIRLVREVLREGPIHSELHVVRDGIEALQFLRQEGPYGTAPRVELLWLDLNMPRKDGREVLHEVKTDARLRKIPVIVMTSSAADEDVARAYENHANCYVRKPVDFEHMRQIAQKVKDFWCTVAELPRN
jgi:two-component system, chemotaxis family, response regulator Rcp1